MESQTKNCQNCKNPFTIEQDDFSFYEKISVPPPTFCPECRSQRRMSWRNTRNLYKGICQAPGHSEKIVSVYSPEKTFTIYDQKYWWSDECDALKYGKEYDFSVPFFVQFNELLKVVPIPNISNINPVNTEYTNMTIDSRNCYLVFSGNKNENCSYCEGVNECTNSMDLLASHNNDRVYDSIDCKNCFNVSFCTKVSECIDSMFLYDCSNCSNCFGCWNLRNKKYCIFNEQFSKEAYQKELESFKLDSYTELEKIKKVYKEKLKNTIRKFADIIHSENVTGNGIEFSRNCHNSFDISKTDNSRYVWRFLKDGGSDNYDVTIGTKPQLCYEGNGVGAGYNLKFGVAVGNTADSQYIYSCMSNCSNLFGCISLNSKSYCILNKQYTKEEYEILVPKIIEHMIDMPYVDSKGKIYKYGEFFPSELSPFCYNESMAQEYYPLTKEQALERGYKWKETEKRNYNVDIKNENIPDSIKEVDDTIIGKVIECGHKGMCNEQCTEAFKIIPEELQFYKKANIPLPHFCPNCRHYERLKYRNPMKLYKRKCMCDKSRVSVDGTRRDPVGSHSHFDKCQNEFQTTYAPDRPEKVYCEQCYQKEVL